MSLEGRISVDVLFHDKDGTASLKVVTLQDSQAYTTGKVAVLSGTASTASLQLTSYAQNPTYRDSSGALVTFNSIQRILFSWSGTGRRTLTDSEYDFFKLSSFSGAVSTSDFQQTDTVAPLISSGSGTGTYTIVMYGT